MSQDMDRMCTTIVIAVAVILVCMGYVEMTKMRHRYETKPNTTCGMKSDTSVENVASAKRSMMENKTGRKDTSFMTISEEWPMEEIDCKHKEMVQDDVELKKAFGEWTADSESTKKYIDASVNQEKAKYSANTRPIDISTQARTPLNAKNIGTPGFMTAVRASAGQSMETNAKFFADSCMQFNTTDGYVENRSKYMKA